MTAIGFTGGSHSFPGHAEKLTASGAHAVCATWDEVARELGTPIDLEGRRNHSVSARTSQNRTVNKSESN